MNFGEKAIKFFNSLRPPDTTIPEGIGIMDPFREKDVLNFLGIFYRKFYADNKKRIFLIGINPGRFGGGITGIPFTDPVNLQQVIGIDNGLDKKHELSSRFVYEVVNRSGGPGIFFGQCYLTALSPYGFIRDNKNLNYYDDQDLYRNWKPYLVDWLYQQVDFGANREVAFSLGQGRNLEYLSRINDENGFFNRIEALPHPRWVMQYRYKKRDEYLNLYRERLDLL